MELKDSTPRPIHWIAAVVLGVVCSFGPGIVPAHHPATAPTPAPIGTVADPTQGYPPCATEDSNGCYWDASVQGNGEGRSFIAHEDGTVEYLEGGSK